MTNVDVIANLIDLRRCSEWNSNCVITCRCDERFHSRLGVEMGDNRLKSMMVGFIPVE